MFSIKASFTVQPSNLIENRKTIIYSDVLEVNQPSHQCLVPPFKRWHVVWIRLFLHRVFWSPTPPIVKRKLHILYIFLQKKIYWVKQIYFRKSISYSSLVKWKTLSLYYIKIDVFLISRFTETKILAIPWSCSCLERIFGHITFSFIFSAVYCIQNFQFVLYCFNHVDPIFDFNLYLIPHIFS